MKKWLHRFDNISSRIIAFFLVFIILPIFLIGFFINQSGVETAKREILRSMTGKTYFIERNIEEDFIRTRTYLNQYVSNLKLIELGFSASRLTDYRKIELIRSVQSDLTLFANGSPFIQSIGVILPSIRRVVSVEGQLNDIDQDFYVALASREESNLVEIGGKLYFVARCSAPQAVVEPKNAYVLYVEISPSRILDYIEQAVADSRIATSLTLGTSRFHSTDSDAEPLFDAIRSQVGNPRKASSLRDGLLRLSSGNTLYSLQVAGLMPLEVILAMDERHVYKQLEGYTYLFLYSSLAIAFATLAGILFLKRYISRPMSRLTDGFQLLESEDFRELPLPSRTSEFGTLFRHYNRMVVRLRTLIDTNYRQKLLNQEIELKYLQNQISPHFLYNCFFMINSMIHEKAYDDLQQFSLQMGNFYKYITRDIHDVVPLRQEVEHARVYAMIQQHRYGNRIDLRFADTPSRYEDLPVPRLILQPLMENAFEHSLKNKREGGLLQVDFQELPGELVVSIHNNGLEEAAANSERLQRAIEGDPSVGISTYNINRRLKLLFGDRGGLTFRADEQGLTISVHLAVAGGMDASNPDR